MNTWVEGIIHNVYMYIQKAREPCSMCDVLNHKSECIRQNDQMIA